MFLWNHAGVKNVTSRMSGYTLINLCFYTKIKLYLLMTWTSGVWSYTVVIKQLGTLIKFPSFYMNWYHTLIHTWWFVFYLSEPSTVILLLWRSTQKVSRFTCTSGPYLQEHLLVLPPIITCVQWTKARGKQAVCTSHSNQDIKGVSRMRAAPGPWMGNPRLCPPDPLLSIPVP